MKAQGVKAMQGVGKGPTGSDRALGRHSTGGCLQNDIFIHSGKEKRKSSSLFSG